MPAKIRSRYAPITKQCCENGKRSRIVTQFNMSQEDFPIVGARVACTSISCTAGLAFLRAKGNCKKAFGTNNCIYSVLKDGIDLHYKWVQRDARRKGLNAMAAVDEVIQEAPELGIIVSDECITGMLSADSFDCTSTFGISLGHALRNIFSTKSIHEKPVVSYVLTTRGYSTMFGRKDNKGYIFDSHKRHSGTGLALGDYPEKGSSVLVEFETVDYMIHYLCQLYAFDSHQCELYTLQEITLVEEEKMKSYFTIITSTFSTNFLTPSWLSNKVSSRMADVEHSLQAPVINAPA